MAQQIPLDPSAQAGHPSDDHKTQELTPDLAYKRLAIVNVVFSGTPGGSWVLVDAAVPGTASLIVSAAESRFGADRPPQAIILTHGHFDHVGALKTLAERWNVPIYAHPLELPYLNGQSAYPPPDPTVGGGLMALLSPLYPRDPIDVSQWLKPLPDDGTVPGMPGWRWIHVPGHTPGQVALWREGDRTLIAADAFVTTAQESAYSVATQAPEMHGPPMYFTPDWEAARISVEALAALEPEIAVTGHGQAMQGAEMRLALHRLSREFNRVAVPEHGRYVLGAAPATS